MADSPAKRLRRQITDDSVDDSESEESGDNWEPLNSANTIRVGPKYDTPTASTATMSRPRRAAATSFNNPSSSVTVSRSPSDSPEDRRKSIRLTVKMPSSKLKEVTNSAPPAKRTTAGNPRDSFEAGEGIPGPRSSTRMKEKKKYVEYDESEEDEDEDDEEEVEEEEVDEEMDDFDQIGAEAEGTDDENAEGELDDDVEMDESPVPLQLAKQGGPRVTLKTTPVTITPKANGKQPAKPSLVVTPAKEGHLKSVEEREMELVSGEEEVDDEELSELDSDAEGSEQDETNLDEEDAEGEEEVDGEEDAEGDEEDIDRDDNADSDDEGMPGSGASTPDITKMTARQRGTKIQDDGGFLALPMEPQVKKVLTVEQHRMRRAEMARRRKNLSEKRNEEEKMTTINKLLKRQTVKKRGKAMNPENIAAVAAAAGAADGATPGASDEEVVEKANPYFVRLISNKDGVKIGVPEEWLGKTVGKVFGGPSHSSGRRLVEEIEG